MPYTWDDLIADTDADRENTGGDISYAQKELGAGKTDPREFYRYSNGATKELGQLFATFTGIPEGTKGWQNQHKALAKLLTTFPDLDLIREAVSRLSKRGRIQPGIELYYMRKLVENECSILHGKKERAERAFTDLVDTMEPPDMEPCPRCKKLTYHPSIECKFH